jgi:hypothetical protein
VLNAKRRIHDTRKQSQRYVQFDISALIIFKGYGRYRIDIAVTIIVRTGFSLDDRIIRCSGTEPRILFSEEWYDARHPGKLCGKDGIPETDFAHRW